MSLSMVFGHGFVSTTQQTSTFVIFRAISALRECLRGRAMSVTNPDQVCCQKTISEFLFVNIISVELYQVHLIPYHQSPLTMLLRESLSVERMRQTKVVDEELKEWTRTGNVKQNYSPFQILLVGSLSPCVEDLHNSMETLG